MKSRVAELEAELEAAQRTIDALSDAMERGLSEASTDVPLTLQMLSLEQLVHERTHELASRQGELQAALDELGRTQAQLLSAQKLEAIGQLAAGTRAVGDVFFPGAGLGTLREGGPADFAVYDYDPWTPLDADTLLGHLLYGGLGPRARTVVCGGRVDWIWPS